MNIDNFNKETYDFLVCVINIYSVKEKFSISGHSLPKDDTIFLAMLSGLNKTHKYDQLFKQFNLHQVNIRVENKDIKLSDYVEFIKTIGVIQEKITPIEIFYNFLKKNYDVLNNDYETVPNVKKTFEEFYKSIEKEVNRLQKKDNVVTPRQDEIIEKTRRKVAKVLNDVEQLITGENEENTKNNKTNNFYSNISIELINYIEYVYKIYDYLTKKIDIPTNIWISDNNDLLSLAIILSSNKYKNYLMDFYNEKNITLETVSSLIGINLDEVSNINGSTILTLPSSKEKSVFFEKIDKFIVRSYETSVDDFIRKYIDMSDNKLMSVIYSLYARRNITNSLNVIIDNYYRNKKEKELKAEENDFLKKCETDASYDLIRRASLCYKALDGIYKDCEEREIFAILYAFTLYDNDDSDLEKYLNSKNISYELIDKYLKTDFNPDEILYGETIDMEIIKRIFEEYIELDLYSIMEKSLTKINCDLQEYYEDNDINKRDFIDLKEKVNEYVESQKEEEEKTTVRNLMSKLRSSEIQNEQADFIFTNATKVYGYLNDNNLFNDEISDRVDMSLLISYLLSYNDSIKYFNRYGVSIEEIEKYLNVSNLLESISKYQINEKLLINEFLATIEDCISWGDIETYITNNNKVLADILCKKGYNIKSLKYEVENDTEIEEELTKEEILEKLKNEEVEELTDDISSIVNFGNSLSKCINAITEEFESLLNSNSLDETLSLLTKETGKIYDITPVVKKEKNLVERVFNKKDVVISEEKKKINVSVILGLGKKIDASINILNKELIIFDYLRKYYQLYINKTLKYIEIAKNKLKGLEQSNDENDEYNSRKTIKDILEIKLDAFNANLALTRTEYIKINIAMKNHYSVIQGLTTARDILLPFIQSELLVNSSTRNENNAIDVSNQIVELLKTIANNNKGTSEYNTLELEKMALNPDTVREIKENYSSIADTVKTLEETLSNVQDIKLELTNKGGDK